MPENPPEFWCGSELWSWQKYGAVFDESFMQYEVQSVSVVHLPGVGAGEDATVLPSMLPLR